MAAGQHADQQFVDYLPLSDNDLAQLGRDFSVGLVQSLDGVVVVGSHLRLRFVVHAGFSQ